VLQGFLGAIAAGYQILIQWVFPLQILDRYDPGRRRVEQFLSFRPARSEKGKQAANGSMPRAQARLGTLHEDYSRLSPICNATGLRDVPRLGARIMPKPMKVDIAIIAPYPTLGEVSKRVVGAWFTPQLFSSRTRKVVSLMQRLP
jgi:hypothetical protein